MSYKDLEQAMSLAPKCKFFRTVGGKNSDEIKKSEELLGITFSKQCIEFYTKFGYLSFFGNEIFGIFPYDDSGELEGNSVAYALNDREKLGLSDKWIPIYNFNDGSMAYLDYQNLNDDNEPQVIMGEYNGEEFVLLDVIAEDFGEFLLSLIKEELD